MKHEVSIIMPVYQVEAYIEDSAISVCNQTFKNFEVILVNDGTKDESISIAESIFIKNKVPYTVINKSNSGLPAARNSGFRVSNSEWVISIDSDDIIDTRFVEKLLNYAKEAKVNIAFCDLQNISLNDNNNLEPKYNKGREIYNRDRFQKLFLRRDIVPVVAAMIFKREWLVHNNLYLNEECFFGGDQNFIWKASFHFDKVLHIKEPLYYYLKRPNSIMTAPNPKKIIKGYVCMCALVEEMSRIDPNNKILGFILPRWLLGTLRTISRNATFVEFVYISDYCKASEKMRTLYRFPDVRVKILSIIFNINKNIFYTIIHKVIK
jgi:glycosyltransferase involved in cell wall biosynthesis